MRLPPPLAFAACTLIWGTTWLAIKLGYVGLDPLWGAALRFFVAAAVLTPWVLLQRVAWPSRGRQIGVVVFVGLAMFGLDYGLIYWAEQSLPSGFTAVLFATAPFFIALFASFTLPQERLTPRAALGLVLGLVGLIVVFHADLRASSTTLAPAVAIVASASAAAASTVVIRRWGRDLAPSVLNATSMLIGAVALTAASLLRHERIGVPGAPAAWLSLLYLSLIGSVVAFLLYWDLLKQWSPNRAGLVTLLTPIVAVAAGLALGERLTPVQWWGSAVVLTGVALALRGRTARATTVPTLPA